MNKTQQLFRSTKKSTKQKHKYIYKRLQDTKTINKNQHQQSIINYSNVTFQQFSYNYSNSNNKHNNRLQTQNLNHHHHPHPQNILSKYSRNFMRKIKEIKNYQGMKTQGEYVQEVQQESGRDRVRDIQGLYANLSERCDNYSKESYDTYANLINTKNMRISILCVSGDKLGDKLTDNNKPQKNLLQPSLPTCRSYTSQHPQKQKQQQQFLQQGVGKIKLLQLLSKTPDRQIYKGILTITQNNKPKSQEIILKKIRIDQQRINREEFMVRNLRSQYVVGFKGLYKQKQKCNGNHQNLQNHVQLQTNHHHHHQYLKIVMQKYDMDLKQIILTHTRLPTETLRIYIYQMVRSLVYLHSKKICHRDIKPDNFFVKKWKIVLGDFGMAKILRKGYDVDRRNREEEEGNLAYVFQREYRAPELLLGYEGYGLGVDIWALGCVIAEMHTGKPIFTGRDNLDQLIKIMKVIGSPPWSQLSFYPTSPKLPKIDPIGLKQALRSIEDKSLLNLLQKILQFDPKNRPTAIQILCSPYFDPIRQQSEYKKIASEYNCPNLFYFTARQLYGNQQMIVKLVPFWVKQYCRRHKLKISEMNRF